MPEHFISNQIEEIEQKLKENQLDKIDVSDFAKLYKNQITYDFANLYNSFEFNISKEDQEDFNICLNYYLEQENQYFVIKPENTYYYDADISDSLQKVNNTFLKNKLDYIKNIINESILENNYDDIEEQNNDIYFKSLLEKYSNNFLEKEILDKIERDKNFNDDYYSNRKEKNPMDDITLEDLKEKYKKKDKEYSELLHQQFRAENKNEDTSKIKEEISNIRNELKKIENDINKEEIKKEEKLDKNENNFTLKDIGSDKKVKTLKQFENVIRQLAIEKNQDTAESKFIDFLGYNLEGGMAGNLYDKIFEKYGDPSYSTLKKQIKKEIETKNKNSNTESTLENYKKQALELCSKDNPTLKLTMFIKDLVKNLSIEEKTLLFTNTINNLTEELKKINANTEQDSQINTQKKGRK